MTETRFSYNPFTKDYIESSSSHSVAIYNKGKQKQFDEYIRGILYNNILYLRTYYPFDNLSELSLTELHQKSRQLLEQYYKEILVIIKQNYAYVDQVKFNVENDLLEGIGLANI